MGTPQFALPSLERLHSDGYTISAVVTAPDRASGRGLKVTESDIKKGALKLGIPLLQPTSLKDDHFIEQLRELEADLFVVVAFRMLPKEVWSLPKLGTINLHSSLLPQYRGAAPINHAIIEGEKESGVTTFLIDHQIDTGAILEQLKVKIGEEESAGSLHDRLMVKGAELLSSTVEKLFTGRATPIDQESLIGPESTLKMAPKLTRQNRKIEWSRTAQELHNQIRGLSPYPAAYSTLKKEGEATEVKLFTSSTLPLENNLKPGEIESDGKSFLKVGCGSGSLSIKEIQLAGKRRLPIASFLAGMRDIEQYHFE